MLIPSGKALHWDERRDVIIPGDTVETLAFCTTHLLHAYKEAVRSHGSFCIALSGGSTPKSIFNKMTQSPIKEKIDWSKIHLFWSDERSVPADHPDSNYRMAMDAGFSSMAIPKEQIHRMVAEQDIDEQAKAYEETIQRILQKRPFDYIMLGMGEDGHTASLFPNTLGLSESQKLVCANWIPQKETWRMTLTYPCINEASHIVIYVLGAGKNQTLLSVLHEHKPFTDYPIIKIGTPTHKALWICDAAAADGLKK